MVASVLSVAEGGGVRLPFAVSLRYTQIFVFRFLPLLENSRVHI
jgi:hypothetical protein